MQIADKFGPIQVIYGGKAHPHDTDGKALIEQVINLSHELKGKLKMAYLPNYDMYLAKLMTSGVDVWLNTPMPPHEASGTSGMKCALNGIPQMSILDGWWVEGCIEGETGWSFGTPDDLYKLLEETVVPMFYNESNRWCEVMRKAIMLNGSFFNSHRMLHEYKKRAYQQINNH
jgi:glycogen phosphorylase